MANFEERLISLSDEETLKKAKQLLKQHTLLGAWRNSAGLLCGKFRDGVSFPFYTEVITGNQTGSNCTCGHSAEKMCAHGIALLMYGGRFNDYPPPLEAPPQYTKGLLKQDLSTLAKRGMSEKAKLFLRVADIPLHAPSKWENLILSVKLCGANREYTGNLSNLRQLYFEKSLSVVLKYEDFSLHDQQIIRFLALNGEAQNSNVALSAELTAELFHALPGFPRFFRGSERIIVRPERATPVLTEVKGKLLPGLMIGSAVLPFPGARLITGRSGYWVGKNDEFFFIGGDCEAGFLRSFFRIQAHDKNAIESFPLPVMPCGDVELSMKTPRLLLDGKFDSSGKFTLHTEYLYECSNRHFCFPPRSGKIIADGKTCWKRDTECEKKFENALALFGFEMDDHSAAGTIDDPEKAGLFLDKVLPELIKSNKFEVILAPGLSGMLCGNSAVVKLQLHCSLSEKLQDVFILKYSLTGNGHHIPWDELYLRCMEKNEYIHFDGIVYSIPEELGRFVRASGAMLKSADPVNCTFELPVHNLMYFCKLAAAIPGALPAELTGDASNIPVLPELKSFNFKGSLRSYQLEGVAFMQYLTDRNFNALLADEMGLGKTVQLLALLASRSDKNSAPSLIVCPASLIVNWEREAKRFVPEMRVVAPQGGARVETLRDPGAFDLLILSYTAAKLSSSMLKKYRFNFLVLDEAQHIKNPGSGNAKNCKSISAAHRIVLSGTPLENSPEDLWSVMDFLQPGMLGTLPAFRRHYANIAVDPELQQDLIYRISPFIKRRTKADVAADLPEKNELTMYCDFAPEQSQLYQNILNDGLQKLKESSAAEIFSLLLKLRQICCHPELLADDAAENIPSGKTELLMELLQQNIDSGHKVLLFSQFTSMLKLLIPQLEALGIPFEYLDGSTRDRQKRVDDFNNSPDIPLFLLSLKAGGTGLNLTAADTVILYDPWWNPAVELQAADRTHRIGQTRQVTTIKLVMRNSIEEKVLELQSKKRRLFNDLLEERADCSKISIDELKELLTL